MKQLTPRYAVMASAGLVLLFLLIFYYPVIFSPNDFLFSTQVDGLNNYFNFLWHSKHDASYTHFAGMAYPYGEHWLYTDSHPLLSSVLNFVSRYVGDVTPYGVGMLNGLMLFSFVVSVAFFCLILLHFRLSPMESALGSVGIVLLASQVLEWEVGHYSLSYTCFIPVGWYLLIRFFQDRRQWLWSLLIAVHTLLWFFTHSYLGVMLLGFTLIVFVFKQGIKWKSYGHLLLQIGLPVVVVYLAVKLGDEHEGRFEFPFVTAYRTSFWTLLYPSFSFLQPVADGMLSMLGITKPDPKVHLWFPTSTYLGASTIVALVWAMGYALLKKRSVFKSFFRYDITAYLLAGLLLLLYSMAIPFRWWGGLTDVIPFFNQFITLGRFAWVSYFVLTTTALVLLHRLVAPQWRTWIIAGAAAFMILEGLGYHVHLSEYITQQHNFFKADQDLQSELGKDIAQHINPDDFQAILPLPFYYKQNTPFAFPNAPHSEMLSMRVAQQTGLPMLSAFLARPSILEGMSVIELFAPSPVYQSTLKFPNDKPLLVVQSQEELQPMETLLSYKTQLILHRPTYRLYQISPKDIFEFNTNAWQVHFDSITQHHYFDPASGYYLPDSNFTFYYYDFEDRPNANAFRGQGAFEAPKDKQLLLYQSAPGTYEPEKEYVLSFWFYNKLNQQTYCRMWIEEVNSQGEVVSTVVCKPYASVVFDGFWAWNEHWFSVSDTGHSIRLLYEGQGLLAEKVWMDELMIRDGGVDLYGVRSGGNGKKEYLKNGLGYWRE